tara:strand:- start:269 stop:1009 length:741 start_codon:yes stop_codon:yes gene_type:complete
VSDPLSSQLIIAFPSYQDDSFSSFIPFESSEFAFQAAKSLCENSHYSFNSLFIAGESGLGKTHLLRAIGNYVAINSPEEKALYMDGGRFAQKVSEGDRMDGPLNEILSADYLLLDDVQKISGNFGAQEKLYHVYNVLNQNKKKIIFAANQPPEKLIGLADFLKSRFQWGVIAILKNIDDKSSTLLLQKLAGDLGLELEYPVISFMIKRIPRDFRSLSEAINSVNEASWVKKQKVTIQLVKATLGID